MVVPFSLAAFVPFLTLLGVALSAGAISGYMAFMPKAKPRRRTPLPNAKVVAFPKSVPAGF